MAFKAEIEIFPGIKLKQEADSPAPGINGPMRFFVNDTEVNFCDWGVSENGLKTIQIIPMK